MGNREVKYKRKAEFPIVEARKLWARGWCWRALGNKYGYAGTTIKKWVRIKSTGKEYRKAHDTHNENHYPHCKFCYKNSQKARINRNTEQGKLF